MEYANNEIFNIRYNENEESAKHQEKKSFFKEHKIVSGMIMATILLIGVNSVLIYQFFSTLSTL